MFMTIAVLFERFGPYHLARLVGAAAKLPVVGVEIFARDTTYAWEVVKSGTERWTLFDSTGSVVGGPREIAQRVWEALEEINPTAVAVPGWGTPFALAALRWCAVRGRAAVIMSESTAWDEPRRPWKEAIKRRLVGGFGRAGLVGGTAHADYLVRLGIPRDRVFSGYDAVDNAYFEHATAGVRAAGEKRRAQLGLPERYFLASNRFVEKKNLPRLLLAYADYYREAGADAWSLVLLGDGPGREGLIRQRNELGLESRVLLPGFKQYDELPAYYALAGGFVHASTTEQWGLVVNEAMASSLPVLVSDRCGCAGDLVIDGITGWTFNPENTAALTQALTRLAALSEAERATMGRMAREKIAAWSPEAFGDGLQRAVAAAWDQPRRGAGIIDRWVLEIMMRR